MILCSKGLSRLEENLCLRSSGKRLHPIQIANYIAAQGVKTVLTGYRKNIDQTNMLHAIHDYYGIFAKRIIRQTSFADIYSCIEEPNPNLELSENSILFSNIQKESIYIILLNYDFFIGRPNQYRGHYIVATDIQSKGVRYHDPGPVNAVPDCIVPLSRIEAAWMKMSFLDDGIIEILD